MAHHLLDSSLATNRDHLECVVEMVYHQNGLIENVENVGDFVAFPDLVLNRDILEIAHGVERSETIEPTMLTALTRDTEAGKEVLQGMDDRLLGLPFAGCIYGRLAASAVWVSAHYLSVCHGHTGNGMDGDKGATVLRGVIVGTLHERGLRIDVPQAHVDPNGGVKVAEKATRDSLKVKSLHSLQPFACD